jgi:pyruvate formate lyase activating enzyme
MNNFSHTEAKWWHYDQKGRTVCTLCPRYCALSDGQAGFCYVRKNIDGKLYTLSYGRPTGFAIDPIEKKPLFHFLPGSEILSFGTAGCNLGCVFCQNWTMSKARTDDLNALHATAEEVIQLVKKYNVPSIAYTYNDPTVFAEYVIDIAEIARQENIKSVMVTAGYIDKEAREEVYKDIDAANVDLKAFSEEFYVKLTNSHLNDVLDTLKWLKNETDVWIEITTLLIPGENDSPEELKRMCDWITENLGDDIPHHFTAFHPDFKLRDKARTSLQTLKNAAAIAKQAGMKYVYLGNVSDTVSQTTFCPHCGTALIKRDWHSISFNALADSNKCPKCGTTISGIFKR